MEGTVAKTDSSRARRFVLSLLCAAVLVGASTVAVVLFSKVVNSTAANILGLPMAPGWVLVKGVFGDWKAVHGGQLALVPPLSLLSDWLLIFVVWDFLHQRLSRDLMGKANSLQMK